MLKEKIKARIAKYPGYLAQHSIKALVSDSDTPRGSFACGGGGEMGDVQLVMAV